MNSHIKCRHCDSWFDTEVNSVRHSISYHSNEQVSFLTFSMKDGQLIYKCRTFKVKGNEVACGLDEVYINESGKLVISPNKDINKSPVRKMAKVNTETKSVHSEVYDEIVPENNIKNEGDEFPKHCENNFEKSCTEMLVEDEIEEDEQILTEEATIQKAVLHMQNLLPSVTSHLAKQGRLSEWVSFFNLVSSKVFPVSHISLQLFLDVIKFATIDDVTAMRYSPEVKEFWSVGQSLFKSKFIRFMGGYKTMTDSERRTDKRSNLKADISSVNFICPDRTVIREQRMSYNIECDKPGLIVSNIDAIANVSSLPEKRYNLSIDGKKIAPGFGKNAGEVDLFGHETSPTLQEKKNRLEVEIMCINDLMEDMKTLIEKDVESIVDISADSKRLVKYRLLDIISIMTGRIKEIRLAKVHRQITLDKLLNLGGEKWHQSKYSFAISSIKTQMYTINMLIEQGLEINKSIGLLISGCNGAENLYTLEKVVDLDRQENYVCLRDATKFDIFHGNEIPSVLTKQRNEIWHEERKKAKVTGSTIYKALGLSSLKEQREHYNTVMNGYKKEHDATTDVDNKRESAMDHGIKNEINAVGTLAATILPIYASDCILHEEGFYRVPAGDDINFLIVSPDGSCRIGNNVVSAVEIKCPVPGKKYTPDVHYCMPKYYVGQCLAEMAALQCMDLYYLSWTPESTTVLKAEFDEDLWNLMKNESMDLYSGDGKSSNSKLSKKRPAVHQIEEHIQNYVKNKVTLIGEFPSIMSLPCRHEKNCTISCVADLKGTHTMSQDITNDTMTEKVGNIKLRQLTPIAIQTCLKRSEQCVNEMYNILRIPAKEVIVGVLSDLDRTSGNSSINSVPVAYGLSGYSLKIESLRSMMNEIVEYCAGKGIAIKSISTDGQFYRICVRSASGEPLTILQVAKDTWGKARKISKADQIQKLMQYNYKKYESDEHVRRGLDIDRPGLPCSIGPSKTNRPIVVNGWKEQPWQKMYNPPKLNMLLEAKLNDNGKTNTVTENLDYDDLPLDAAELLQKNDDVSTKDDTTRNDLSLAINRSVEFENSSPQKEFTIPKEVDLKATSALRVSVESIPNETLVEMVEGLKSQDLDRKNKKWKRLDTSKLKHVLTSEPSTLTRTLTKNELMACASPFQQQIGSVYNRELKQLSKLELVNAVSVVFGNKSVIGPKKSPKPLRLILKDYFSRKCNKEALNAITATRMFLDEELPKWRQNSVFKDNIQITGGNQDDCQYTWYSQPEYFPSVDDYIVFLLDCHHLFVNARSYVCQHDIAGLNVCTNAWLEVARSPDSSEIGLNQAMVVDVIDKQSNAIAQIVFSKKVENKMKELGWVNEAIFCRHMREWYAAEDEPGLSVDLRHQRRMEMRSFLLSSINFAEFPPPGLHVAGMPIVMFEGILTNIDRRIQLHALVPGNAYNVRAPNTLAVENLFSGFQDLDPKSSGVLLADDVSHALETASYLIQMRLNPERPFMMRTSRATRMYPVNVLHSELETGSDVTIKRNDVDRSTISKLTHITMKDHSFDMTTRRQKNPKRKKGTVPDYDKPSRGAMPVRQYHKTDSSKILPHVRHGLMYDI